MSLAKTFLAIGIAIVFAVFIGYGLFTLYEPPRYDHERSSCYREYNCSAYFDSCHPDKENLTEPRSVREYCWEEVEADPSYQECQIAEDECEEAFAKTTIRYGHYRNSFWILFIIAVGAIIGGMFISGLDAIRSGLLGGGVLVLLWSLIYTIEYWIRWSKYGKLVALGLVLVLLIYLGYKKIESKTVKKKRRKR